MLSSNRDDSFIKLPKTSSVFLPCELRNLRVLVLFEVKMETIMVLIDWSEFIFFFFIGLVVYFYSDVVSCIVSPGCLF